MSTLYKIKFRIVPQMLVGLILQVNKCEHKIL